MDENYLPLLFACCIAEGNRVEFWINDDHWFNLKSHFRHQNSSLISRKFFLNRKIIHNTHHLFSLRFQAFLTDFITFLFQSKSRSTTMQQLTTFWSISFISIFFISSLLCAIAQKDLFISNFLNLTLFLHQWKWLLIDSTYVCDL